MGFGVVVGVFGEASGKDVESFAGDDADGLVAGVWREVDVRDAWLVEEAGRCVADDQKGCQIGYLSIISCIMDWYLCVILTNSPRRAKAGSRVGCTSRCLSMPSKTSMYFP